MELMQYGMVGGGPDGNIGNAHRKALKLSGAAVLTAGCFSRHADKNRQMAGQLGVAPDRCYESYAEMACAEALRPDGIRFVVVVTPNSSHYEICKCFLEAGIAVACDKPLTVELAQAEALERLAAERRLPFMVTYTYTGHHMFRRMRALISSGALGTIRKVMAEYPQSWLADEHSDGGKQGQWRMDPKQSGGTNCLGDIGSHVENAVSTLTGLKLKRVLAMMNTVVPGRVLDDDDVVLTEYSDGTTGAYWVSQFAFGHDNDLRVRVYGSEGSCEWGLAEPAKLTLFDAQNRCTVLTPQPEDVAAYGRYEAGSEYEPWNIAMSNLYLRFMEHIRNPELPADYPTAAAGVESMRFIRACLESSSRKNVWVTV